MSAAVVQSAVLAGLVAGFVVLAGLALVEVVARLRRRRRAATKVTPPMSPGLQRALDHTAAARALAAPALALLEPVDLADEFADGLGEAVDRVAEGLDRRVVALVPRSGRFAPGAAGVATGAADGHGASPSSAGPGVGALAAGLPTVGDRVDVPLSPPAAGVASTTPVGGGASSPTGGSAS